MSQKIFMLLLFIWLPNIIFAHGSHGNGIMAGFTHPIFGLDHNIAILASGILGYILDQKKWYLYPFTFILLMILGGIFGINKEATIFIEKVIAFSVLSIGFIIALRKYINYTFLIILLAIFGSFHGYAHGAEMSETNTAFKYISGYTLGATLLAIIGVFIGKKIHSQNDCNTYINIISGIIIGCGAMMLLQ